ncbi:hypothetical protein KC361_g16 [Hortaea werneckii]|nr:hypothetical protein KC361_g16 [Hortaea werneckii]
MACIQPIPFACPSDPSLQRLQYSIGQSPSLHFRHHFTFATAVPPLKYMHSKVVKVCPLDLDDPVHRALQPSPVSVNMVRDYQRDREHLRIHHPPVFIAHEDCKDCQNLLSDSAERSFGVHFEIRDLRRLVDHDYEVLRAQSEEQGVSETRALRIFVSFGNLVEEVLVDLTGKLSVASAVATVYCEVEARAGDGIRGCVRELRPRQSFIQRGPLWRQSHVERHLVDFSLIRPVLPDREQQRAVSVERQGG